MSLPVALRWLVLWLLLSAPAQALVIHPNTLLGTPDPTVAPVDDPGWGHVGRFGSGSAVYLGQNGVGESWILTAAHVGSPGSVNLGGTSYTTDAFVDFTAPGGGAADLRAWRLVGDPGLPRLAISASTPLAGAGITSIGFGRADGAFTCWDAGWSAGSCVAPAHSGYVWDPRVQQWGTNQVSPASPGLDLLVGGFADAVFATQFDDVGTVLETQAASGDSGGAAFVQNAGTWELAGLALAIGWTPDDPQRPSGVAALDEDYTFYLDLSAYRGQILGLTGVPVPEPGTGGLVALGLLGLALRRRGR